MLSWLDFILIAVFLTVVLVQVKRGFGRAVFDFFALFVAIRVVPLLSRPLAGMFKVALEPATNHAIIYACMFVFVGGTLVVLGRLIYSSTLISAEIFDPLLGGIFGIGAAVILAHAIVKTIAIGVGSHLVTSAVANSALGMEFLKFETYHRVLETLYTFHRPETEI
jgi:uncharacterized membrane protein required for colicin V production